MVTVGTIYALRLPTRPAAAVLSGPTLVRCHGCGLRRSAERRTARLFLWTIGA